MGHICTKICICCILVILVLVGNPHFYLVVRTSVNTSREGEAPIKIVDTQMCV